MAGLSVIGKGLQQHAFTPSPVDGQTDGGEYNRRLLDLSIIPQEPAMNFRLAAGIAIAMAVFFLTDTSSAEAPLNTPPEGFIALFNGLDKQGEGGHAITVGLRENGRRQRAQHVGRRLEPGGQPPQAPVTVEFGLFGVTT